VRGAAHTKPHEVKRVALYARVSSEGQAEKDVSIPAQFRLLREWAAKQSHVIVAEYCDKAQSGRTDKRGDFQRMIADAKRKPAPFDIIACWKSSRFTRNREDAVVYKALLRKRGIDFVSISEPFDDSPAGKLLEGMIEAIDEFYSLQLSQEVSRGMAEAARQGRWLGSKPPLGYRLQPVSDNGRSYTTLALNEETAPEVRRMFDLALAGNGVNWIAKTMRAETGRPWTPNGIHQVISHPVYTGALVWGRRDTAARTRRPREEWVYVPDHHPAIVSQEDFDKLQRMLESRRPSNMNPRVAGSRRLLSGLLRCHCGSLLGISTGRGNGGEYFYYVCNNRQKKQACSTPRLSGVRADTAVLNAIRERLFTQKNLATVLAFVNEELTPMASGSLEELEQLQTRLTAAEKRRQRLLDLLETGSSHFSDATLGERLTDLTQEVVRLRGEVNTLTECTKGSRPVKITRSLLRTATKDIRQLLRRMDPQELRVWLSQVVERITVAASGELTVYSRMPRERLALLSQYGGS